MLRLYCCDIRDTEPSEAALPLSDYRRERLRAVRAPQLRQEMLAAERLLIRAVLDWNPAIALPLEIGVGEKGKPYFAALPLSFSLSHSGLYVACALADFPIGVDIQRRTHTREALLRRCFSEEEHEYILSQKDPDGAFTALWSLKESYVKALGTGLTLPLSSFSIRLENTLSLKGDNSVNFWTRSEGEYQLSICALNGNSPIPDIITAGM